MGSCDTYPEGGLEAGLMVVAVVASRDEVVPHLWGGVGSVLVMLGVMSSHGDE